MLKWGRELTLETLSTFGALALLKSRLSALIEIHSLLCTMKAGTSITMKSSSRLPLDSHLTASTLRDKTCPGTNSSQKTAWWVSSSTDCNLSKLSRHPPSQRKEAAAFLHQAKTRIRLQIHKRQMTSKSRSLRKSWEEKLTPRWEIRLKRKSRISSAIAKRGKGFTQITKQTKGEVRFILLLFMWETPWHLWLMFTAVRTFTIASSERRISMPIMMWTEVLELEFRFKCPWTRPLAK